MLRPMQKIAIIIILIIVMSAGARYRSVWAKTEVMTAASEDGQHSLVVYEIGEPVFPFGQTNCRLDLFEGKRSVTKCPVTVYNDGAHVHEENFSVTWGEDSVQVTVSGNEMEDAVYTLGY